MFAYDKACISHVIFLVNACQFPYILVKLHGIFPKFSRFTFHGTLLKIYQKFSVPFATFLENSKVTNRCSKQTLAASVSVSPLTIVVTSALSPSLSLHRSSCQAIFEVISSEHSYLHSLEILVRMFKNSAELSEAMTKTEHHHLFSNITDVCEASTK